MILPLKAPFFVAGSYHLCSKRRAEMVSLEHATMASHKRKKSERHPGPGVDWNGTVIWYWNLWWLSPPFWETHTYIYIYIYIYIHIYIHIISCMCVCLHIYIHTYVLICSYSSLFIFIHICSCLFICVHICSYVFIFIRIYEHIFKSIHICSYFVSFIFSH